jgi:hypothetical protein
MRDALSKLFNALPSDVFSFVAGAVFSAAINLATARVDLNKSLRLPFGLLAVATFGFIVLGFALKTAREAATERPNPKQAYFNKISDALPTLLMDDSHACSDAIREACSIRLPKAHKAYQPMLDLFSSELQYQGAGSFADIQNGKYDTVLPVPYWAWRDRHAEVTNLLAKYSTDDALKFIWPLLKDDLAECLCVFSGNTIEIAPYLPPLSHFGSYAKADFRVFMSATITNDSFLVRGLET